MNEKGLGKGIKCVVYGLGVRREELFVSIKVWNSHRGYDKTLRAFDESMKKLGVQPEGWAPYFPKQAAGIHREKAWQNTGSAHFALGCTAGDFRHSEVHKSGSYP